MSDKSQREWCPRARRSADLRGKEKETQNILRKILIIRSYEHGLPLADLTGRKDLMLVSPSTTASNPPDELQVWRLQNEQFFPSRESTEQTHQNKHKIRKVPSSQRAPPGALPGLSWLKSSQQLLIQDVVLRKLRLFL